LAFDSQWTRDGKNSPKFERTEAVMHRSSPWMLGEQEGFFVDLTRLLEQVCPYHTYPVKNKLKDYDMIKNFMILVSLN
jgi:hypothetical protein